MANKSSSEDLQLNPVGVGSQGPEKPKQSAATEEITYFAHDTTEAIKRDSVLEEAERRPVSSDVTDSHARERAKVMDCSSGWAKLAFILLGITGLLLIILLPMSFRDLEYYEMGFQKSKVSGSVDTSKVYFSGRYFLGVGSTFKKFRADAHTERFTKFSIYNKEKIQISMTCSLQYFLRAEDLKLLHDAYDVSYEPVLSKTVAAAIKNAASQYAIEDYRLERHKVAAGLETAAAAALGGVCCRKDCAKNRCRPGCVPYGNCNATMKGLFADLRWFQMQVIDIPDDQESRFLQQVLAQEKADTEEFKQTEAITRKETERLRKEIENEALESGQNATTRAKLVRARAEVESKAVVEDARNYGLSGMFELLGVKNEEQKKSLDYVRTLLGKPGANIYIGFNTVVAKP